MKFSRNKNNVHVTVVLLAIGLGLLSNSAQVVAQQQQNQPDKPASAHAQYMALLDRIQHDAQARILARISEIEEVTGPSEQQIKDLQAAGKNAIKLYMAGHKRNFVSLARSSGIEFDPDSEPNQNKKEADAELSYIVGRNLRWSIYDPNSVETKQWWSSVKNTLTAEQNSKIAEWADQRKARQQAAAVRHAIARVDHVLLLSPGEREKLSTAINDKYGPLLATASNRDDVVGGSVSDLDPVSLEERSKNSAFIRDVISDSQLVLWEHELGIKKLVSGKPNSYYYVEGPQLTLDEAAEVLRNLTNNLLESQSRSAESRIKARIHELERVVQLSAQQAKKLSVAAKGATESYMKKTKERVMSQTSNGRQLTDRVVKQVWELRKKALESSINVELENIWASSLKNALTDDQVAKLQSWNSQRDAYRRSAAVSQFIDRVDQDLLLSAKQREQLTAVINDTYGSRMSKGLGKFTSMPNYLRDLTDQSDRVMEWKPEWDTSLVDEILTEPQIALWKRKYGYEIYQIEQVKLEKE